MDTCLRVCVLQLHVSAVACFTIPFALILLKIVWLLELSFLLKLLLQVSFILSDRQILKRLIHHRSLIQLCVRLLLRSALEVNIILL